MRIYRMNVNVQTARITGGASDLRGCVVVVVKAPSPAEARATLSRPNGLRLEDGRSVGLAEYVVTTTAVTTARQWRRVGTAPVLALVDLGVPRRS